MMIATPETTIGDEARTLATSAFRLGYEGRVAFGEEDVRDALRRMDDLLRQLARQIHPNEYSDIREELRRCQKASACSNDPASDGLCDLFRHVSKRCDDLWKPDRRLAEWYRLGREIGVSCWLASSERGCPPNVQRLRKCVELIPQEIRRTDALARVVDLVTGGGSAEVVLEAITESIPTECLAHLQPNAVPFHSLFKLVTAGMATSMGTSPIEDLPAPNDEPYSDHSPPPDLGFFGPVRGTQKEVARALEMDTRTMKDLHRRGQLWIHRVTGRDYDFYFKTQARYEYVQRNMVADANGAK